MNLLCVRRCFCDCVKVKKCINKKDNKPSHNLNPSRAAPKLPSKTTRNCGCMQLCKGDVHGSAQSLSAIGLLSLSLSSVVLLQLNQGFFFKSFSTHPVCTGRAIFWLWSDRAGLLLISSGQVLVMAVHPYSGSFSTLMPLMVNHPSPTPLIPDRP
jgi:hypothetical protein